MSSDWPCELASLVNAARQGDAGAVELVLTRYRPLLRVMCGVRLPELCQRRDDASDLVQETLIDAARGMPEFRGETIEEFEAWMLRLLERNLLQSLRRNTAEKRDVRRERAISLASDSGPLSWCENVDGGSSPSQIVMRGEAAILLATAIEQLPESQRIAVILRFLAHHSLERIAEIMNVTKGAVAGLLRRGVSTLRDLLPSELAERSS
jgi:RNA polymerase sigma-70 factor (ECF subfamily)